MRLAAFLTVCAALAMPPAGPLTIVNPKIAQSDGGTPVPGGFTFVPGDILFFSFQVQNSLATGDEQKISLSYKVDVLDPAGVRMVQPIVGAVQTQLAPQDKDWKPLVRTEIPISPFAPSGTFKIHVEVTDEQAHTTATKDTTFDVRGRSIAPSETLTIRNFRFYRSEQSTEALAKAAYRPGDTLWARFDITGYKLAEGNRIDVSYGIAVLSADGKQLWAQPEAAVEQSQSFYPKRYVPGSMSLNLEPKVRPGEYALQVTARDAIGNQTYEAKQPFFVEQ